PATMSVVPRVNSLIGMPNPMAAMPTAAITIPNKDNSIDMFTPRSAILGSGHDAMVTKEFWPRSAPTAITNVSLRWPNPILINAGRDALTPATSALGDALITRHANAFKPAGKTLTGQAVRPLPRRDRVPVPAALNQNADSIRCPGARSGLMS